MRRARVRLPLMFAAIVLVAALTRLANWGWGWIIGLVSATWLVSALIEKSASERVSPSALAAIDAAPADGAEGVRPLPRDGEPEPEPEPVAEEEPAAPAGG